MITEQLIKTVRLVHSKNFEYKTPIQGSKPYLYIVVTRVNYLTAQLWLEMRNKAVSNGLGGNLKGFTELPQKPNWLVMNRRFRRDEDKKIKKLQITVTNPRASE